MTAGGARAPEAAWGRRVLWSVITACGGGGGRGVRESQEDIQDRSQGGSVVPEGVLQGLRGESPGLDLAGWFVPYRVLHKT